MKVYPFIAWLILTGLMCFMAQKYCCHSEVKQEENSSLQTSGGLSNSAIEEPVFQFNSPLVKVDSNWSKMADSITNILKKSQMLEIKGFSYQNESDSLLGLQRAKNLRPYFSGISDSKIEYKNKVLADSTNDDSLYEMVEFRIINAPLQTNRNSIIKKGDKTLIYFKTGSSKQIADHSVLKYLDDIAARVINSGEKIKLTGHTDDEGSQASNIRLGEMRATIVEDYLIKRGVSPMKIVKESKGEMDPIASNKSKNGRYQNRRTELVILK